MKTKYFISNKISSHNGKRVSTESLWVSNKTKHIKNFKLSYNYLRDPNRVP